MSIHCPTCVYDITGLPAAQVAGACPECGITPRPAALRDHNAASFFRWPLRLMVFPSLICFILAAAAAFTQPGVAPGLQQEVGIACGFFLLLGAALAFITPSLVSRRRAQKLGMTPEWFIDELFIGVSTNIVVLVMSIILVGILLIR